MLAVAACSRSTTREGRTIVADDVDARAPVPDATAPDTNSTIVGVLRCQAVVPAEDCFGVAGFPLHCRFVGTTPADESALWNAVWRDGKTHAQFDALDAFSAAKSPRLPDARCLRTGADDDYNMFEWCCRQ